MIIQCHGDPLGELRQPDAVAAYVEVAFHTFRPDVDWMRPENQPALEIANGIDNYFGRPRG